MQVEDRALRDFLIDSGLMTRSQLASVSLGERPLYDTLLTNNILAEDELRRAAAHATGTAFVVLTPDNISPAALVLVPEPLSRTHNLLAYQLEGDVLEVALLDLDDLAQVAALHLPYRIKPRLTTRTSIKHGLLYYQKLLKEKFAGLLKQGAHVVDALLHHALLSNAHGIHVDIHTGALVRYRIGEALHEAMQLPLHVGAQLSERLKTLAKLLPASSSVQEGRFKFDKDGEMHTVHVSALPTHGGERLVLRLARESAGSEGFALTSLGLHGSSLEAAHALLRQRSGLILVAGPKGAGKTTTLYTLLDQLDHRKLSIATIEEKVEHRFAHIAQTHTKPALGVTMVAGLRALLRQDPDVVMVGEVADSDTALLAAHAASMGVLVLAGVDLPAGRQGYNSAAQAVDRMRHFSVSPLALAATLRGVVGVDVVKKLCPHDREEYLLSRAEGAPLESVANFGRVLAALKEERLVDDDKQWKEILFARAVGCSQCEAGYRGVVGLQEVIQTSAVLKDLLRTGAGAGELAEAAQATGTLNIIEDALFKAAIGQTSVEEVFKLAECRQG